MRLDILDEQPLLKICTGYDFRGKRFDHPSPTSPTTALQANL